MTGEPDPSRTEAAAAGAFHERAEAVLGPAGVGPREHVTAADALADLPPDYLAQHANADVAAPPQDARRLAILLAAVVAAAVTLAVVAVAVVIAYSAGT